jgi:TolB-like protein
LTGGPRVWIGAALAALLVIAAPLEARAQQSAMTKAKEAYQFAEYQKATELFSTVANDAQAGEESRRTALRYLARAHVAQNQRSKAKRALEKLVNLEPPAVEMNPDVEPPAVYELYYEVRQEMSDSYKVGQQQGLQTLAVMDFSNNSITDRERWNGLKNGVPSMMINFLSDGVDLRVIERERIEWILDELELQKTETVDQSTAVETGQVLGANAVVFGSYIVHEGEMMLQARVVDVETSEVLLGEEVSGDPDDFYSLAQELSNQVARAVNVEMEETKMGARQTKSLDAMMAYSDGLEQMEDGNYLKAYNNFRAALQHDGSFERARQKAQSLRPMMASANIDQSQVAPLPGEEGAGGTGR